MSPPENADEFYELMTRSRLLTSQQVGGLRKKYATDAATPARRLARTLVRGRILTPFQGERLLEGRYRGLVIDRYRIREILGFGGMGCVYIAEDTESRTKVAVKVMSPQYAENAGMVARLKLEAHAGMVLTHPNLLKTLDISTGGAVSYTVMELIRGISLHELAALRGPLAPRQAADVIAQAAAGLEAAHQSGILHRDIKPANFLIEPDGHTRILDFGLALVQDRPEDEFSLSMLFGQDCLGTPDYIAPEQSLDSSRITPAADIYSLGATLYVALTAHVPFPVKGTPQKLKAHRTQTPRPVTEHVPSLSGDLADIVQKMMARDPSDRPQSMAEVVKLLSPHASKTPVDFDFRELITIRTKQARARARAEVEGKKKASGHSGRSSITSPSGWLADGSHGLSSGTGSFATPAPQEESANRAPVVSAPTPSAAPPPRRKTRPNAPAGWSLRSAKEGTRSPLQFQEIRIGTSADSDIRGAGECDEEQCILLFQDGHWELKQVSRSRPTLINGRVRAIGPVHHGDVLSFGGDSELVLYHAGQNARARRRKWLLLIPAVLALLTYLAWTWL